MRWVPIAALTGSVVGLVAIVSSAMDDGLTYYSTPTEVVRAAEAGSRPSAQDGPVRLGGLVLRGSLERTEQGSTLMLSDGVTDVPVRYAGHIPAAVQEGQGAVVEGVFDDGGTFRATEVVLRHSNEYRRPT